MIGHTVSRRWQDWPRKTVTHILNHCGSSSLYASNYMISKIHEHVYL